MQRDAREPEYRAEVPVAKLKGGSETWYVVQGYRRGKRGSLVPDEPKMARSYEDCQKLAARISTTRPAVIAFSRQGDATTGDFDDPVVIATYGEVPDLG